MAAVVSTTDSRSEFLRIRGLRLHVRRWGADGLPRLLLLTGWLDVSATFQFLAEQLCDRWQVICPDWRGLGLSEWNPQGYWMQDYVADLDALFDHYQADAPSLDLAGHSMGSQVASLYAGLRPERVRRLVLLDGPFNEDQGPERAVARYTAWLDKLKNPPLDKRYDSFDALAASIRRLHPQLSAERAYFVAQCWGREDRRDGRLAVWMRADPQHRLPWPTLHRLADSMAVWRAVTAPVLSIDGGRSGLRPDEATLMHRRGAFRDHRTLVLPQAGHMLHLDDPVATAQAMRDFLCA